MFTTRATNLLNNNPSIDEVKEILLDVEDQLAWYEDLSILPDLEYAEYCKAKLLILKDKCMRLIS